MLISKNRPKGSDRAKRPTPSDSSQVTTPSSPESLLQGVHLHLHVMPSPGAVWLAPPTCHHLSPPGTATEAEVEAPPSASAWSSHQLPPAALWDEGHGRKREVQMEHIYNPHEGRGINPKAPSKISSKILNSNPFGGFAFTHDHANPSHYLILFQTALISQAEVGRPSGRRATWPLLSFHEDGITIDSLFWFLLLVLLD